MKIEAGKFYKARNGDKVEIIHIHHGVSHPAIGYIGKETSVRDWHIDGKYSSEKIGHLDLVSEWEEPRPQMLAYVHRQGGSLYMYPDNGVTFIAELDMVRVPHLDEPAGGGV